MGSLAHSQTSVDRRLGDRLVAQGLTTPQHIEQALRLQEQDGRPIGQVLCDLGVLAPAALTRNLAEQAGLERAELDELTLDPRVLAIIPAELALRHKVLPVAADARTLRLAMADPFDHAAADHVRVLSGRRVQRLYCEEQELLAAARRLYGSSVAKMIADLGGQDSRSAHESRSTGNGQSDGEVSVVELQELAREPSIVNLVNLVLLEAVEMRASDVHIEPFENWLRLKYRVDGMLVEMTPPSPHLHAAIVSRIKIMAGMNIAERFVPQDGHINFSTPRGKVDIRVGTVPTVFGECVAMRILDRATALLSLEQLGLQEEARRRFLKILRKPHGIVLVTGPTGSGKTTTLYAAINHIYTPAVKFITIEDPVEYQLDGVNQIPVNRKRGVDFASGLRAILRQDPDVIMIGETRDRETADIAIRSALTGHLVFSTLHTNDAAGAVTRLLDMGVEPYLLATSLEGVLAQRLVRKTCPHCRQPHVPEPQVLQRLGHRREEAEAGRFSKGSGCNQCRQTGYLGRMGIFELLAITEDVRKVVLRRGTGAEILAACPGHQRMRDDGFRLAAAGETTLEEVLRVTQDTAVEEALS